MAGNLNELLALVLEGYPTDKSAVFKGNKFIADFKRSAKQVVSNVLGRDDLLIKASAGQGGWSDVPWICIFNPEITNGAQEGIYIGYLFAADMSGVYLFQGQGVQAVRFAFGRGYRRELERRAGLIRARVQEYRKVFSSARPRLKSTLKDPIDYELCAGYSKYYARDNLLPNYLLEEDLLLMLEYYDLLISRGGVDNIESISNFHADETARDLSFEETKRYVRHRRIERNTKAAREAKKHSKHICDACGFDFKHIYGDLGEGYIEAHHKVPLHTLPMGQRVQMNPLEDFDLLCSNCHRMVHRRSPVLSVEELRDIIKKNRNLVRD